MSAEIMKELKEIKEQQGEMFKRLFVSNGQTALVEEVKQNKTKIEEHINEEQLVNCGSNRYINKAFEKVISGVVMGIMILIVLGIQSWIKNIT